jgi:hypothetical protein
MSATELQSYIKDNHPEMYSDMQTERNNRRLLEDQYLIYEMMRKSGLSHEQVLNIGIGKEEFKERYDNLTTI